MIKRLSATLVIDSGIVVNSYNFETHLPVGKLSYTLNRLQEFEVDEAVILNTSHTDNPVNDFKEITKSLDSCHISTPLAYGGGITCASEAMEIVNAGAERVVVSSKSLVNSNELFEMCSYLGDQALILHLPLEFVSNEAMVSGKSLINLKSIIKILPSHWGGEVMLSFVANDGAKFPNWNNICLTLEDTMGLKNLILAGGFASAEDIGRGLGFEQVSAVAVGNYLHRTELSVTDLKQRIDANIELRRTE